MLRTDNLDKLNRIPVEPQAKRRRMKPTHKGLIVWHFIAICYYLYTTFCTAELAEGVVLKDLSHTFDEDTIYWVTAKKLNFTVTHNGTAQDNNYWYQADEISAATHGGTHMDSPCHFALGRWCISDIPIERLVVPAAVVDISNSVGDNPNVHLQPQHLLEWEKENGKIADGSLLLIRTGWSRFWPDPLKYSGTTERNVSLLKFPSIEPGTAKWLIMNRNIVGIGIDSMSVDVPGGVPLTHIVLMEKNIYGLENVNLVEPLPPKGTKVYVMPMKLKGASGAPCRILAELPNSDTSGTLNAHATSLVWTMVILAVLWTISLKL